jgi:Protein of unknown function (DUF3175)
MAARKKRHRTNNRRWSQHVTEESHALDLERSVFAGRDPKKMARSLKHSAEHSRRRKTSAYRSAMSMITFYINRAGKQLPPRQKRTIEAAKDELRRLYGKKAAPPSTERKKR